MTKINNLSTLRILHIIKAVLGILGAIFILLLFGGSGLFFATQDLQNEDLPFNPGVFMAGMGVFAGLAFSITGILNFLAAKYIREERNHTFLMIVSVINCFSGILGILLGIFTIIEIQRADVKELFDEKWV